MKFRTILLTLIVSVLSLVACELYAQETNEAARRANTIPTAYSNCNNSK